MAVKPEDDFQGYMENIAQREVDEREMEEMFERHRVWRETTWGGFAVRQIQALANHFEPFFQAVADSMRDEDSAGSILFMTIIRLLVIFISIAMFYLAAHLVQTFIGTEYVVEEEEIVVIDGDEDEVADKNERSSRDKKDK
ncbi:expressed unknown protein [Seminavis robusta]|uniref:Transmembrane protein n=1 Tax=Seminavis robusta TaxID=568900 RepID=A0A9N8HXD3_9STRA|nr:expressed unknown protein [Seminavis robusta]|eukprot:Sro1790_g297750.1 n/a (141) ;mRNA; r:17577-18207